MTVLQDHAVCGAATLVMLTTIATSPKDTASFTHTRTMAEAATKALFAATTSAPGPALILVDTHSTAVLNRYGTAASTWARSPSGSSRSPLVAELRAQPQRRARSARTARRLWRRLASQRSACEGPHPKGDDPWGHIKTLMPFAEAIVDNLSTTWFELGARDEEFDYVEAIPTAVERAPYREAFATRAFLFFCGSLQRPDGSAALALSGYLKHGTVNNRLALLHHGQEGT